MLAAAVFFVLFVYFLIFAPSSCFSVAALTFHLIALRGDGGSAPLPAETAPDRPAPANRGTL